MFLQDMKWISSTWKWINGERNQRKNPKRRKTRSEKEENFHARLHEKHQEITDYLCKPAAKINEHDDISGDSACQIDRNRQDHTAFGIEIDQHLRFQKDKNIVKNQPQNSWTTLFTSPFFFTLFTSPFVSHFREWAHFIYYPLTNPYSTLGESKGNQD